ncbi:unnamed protein product [Amoebophrya sp. A120]|nr:unnamed protein product [Amoebophrya sp. A120]|eukprot:GSA120T00025862001.1
MQARARVAAPSQVRSGRKEPQYGEIVTSRRSTMESQCALFDRRRTREAMKIKTSTPREYRR